MQSLANRHVLVLNKNWMAIGVVTLERAVSLLFSTYKTGEPKAKIIDPSTEFQTYTWEDWSALRPKDGEAGIHTVRAIFRIPEIIVLSKYDKLPMQRVHFSRRTIYRRDNNQCQYCGCKPGTPELTIDHVKPKAQGGKTSWENCVLACVACNSKKADRTPEQCGMKLLRQPKKPKFNLFKGDVRIKSWESFMSEAYWQTDIENDNDDEL